MRFLADDEIIRRNGALQEKGRTGATVSLPFSCRITWSARVSALFPMK
jgi:hypothetical protein